MPTKKENEAVVMFRCPSNLKLNAETRATKLGMKLSQYIRQLIIKDLKSDGLF